MGRERLASRSAETRRAEETLLRAHVDAWLASQPPGVLLGFAALPDEPDLGPCLEAWRARGGTVALPRMQADSVAFDAALATAAPLATGALGFLQPDAGAPVIPQDRIGVVLVPALALDARGRRLGRGRGCYDRFLPHLHREARTCAVVFSCQVFDDVPAEPHDFTLPLWIDEHGVHEAGG
jgi:5-formyltetrahydrofolate cyclo-ligase